MGFKNIVSRIVEKADIVIEVLDARFPELTRNEELEKKVNGRGKKLIFALNKSDLVSRNYAKRKKKALEKDGRAVFVSASEKKGIIKLREEIGKASNGQEVKIAIVGVPNIGKSSLLNALKGKQSAKVAPIAGYTKGEQWVRISDKIMLLDSPGVLPIEKADEFSSALTCSKNPEQLSDAEGIALQLIDFVKKEIPEKAEKAGWAEKSAEQVLEETAKKKGKLLKGGKANTSEAGKLIIREWQRGKL